MMFECSVGVSRVSIWEGIDRVRDVKDVRPYEMPDLGFFGGVDEVDTLLVFTIMRLEVYSEG